MKSRFADRFFVSLCLFAVVLVVAMLVVILGNITYHGWDRLSWEFISAAPTHGMTEGGIFPAIYGTLLLVLLMTVFVVPLCICVAIYFSEYADRSSWLYRWTRAAVDNLAGVPSIVFGSPHYHVLFFLGVLLFVVTFALNWVGTVVVGRLRMRLTGADR